MSDMPVTDRMKRQREEERLEIHALGKEIGYGNMMSLASEAWQAELESNYGSDAGAFVVGPCKGLVVPCGCGGSKDCDWCCATGWLTKKVKEIKDASPDDRIIELLKKVLETGKLWIESRNLPAHDSLGTHTLQRVDWISDLRRDFETAISEAIEERPSDGEENSQT